MLGNGAMCVVGMEKGTDDVLGCDGEQESQEHNIKNSAARSKHSIVP